MAGEFCVVCGRTDRPVEEGLCPDCFAKRVALIEVPERSTIVLCPTCGARRLGQRWQGRGHSSALRADDLTPLLRPRPEVAVRSVDWTEIASTGLQKEFEGLVHLRLRGEERTASVRLPVNVEHRTCEECAHRAGHYFTATIQLRGPEEGDGERPAARRERLMTAWDGALSYARPEWRRALSWFEERPEGWDLYLTDTLAARALARMMKARLGGSLNESATLWGRKHGEDVYRVTLCLRVPAHPGAPEVGRRPGRSAPRRLPRAPEGARAAASNGRLIPRGRSEA